MPKLWNDTIEAHRAAVRDATLDAAAGLIAAHGLTAVTMSRIAEATGIGRATLYKYFPDVDAILQAWHERTVTRHLAHLAEIRDQPGDPLSRLTAVLTAYAGMAGHRSDDTVAAALHHGAHVTDAHRRLTALIRTLLEDAAEHIRTDVPVEELASYCLHALAAAGGLHSAAAARRLVDVTIAGLRRPG